MTTPPTPILQTTRFGSRSHVRWLNQPTCCGKGEPNRRKRPPPWPMRKGEPGAKRGPLKPPVEWQASSLLVILHYLLKNNIRIYEDDMCRFQHLPGGPDRGVYGGPPTQGRWGV
jgi:hypothetical protein